MSAKNDGAKSFVAYYSWWEVIGRLDEHQQAQVLQAMFATGGVCEKPELDFVAEIAFIPIEREIQANLEKWEETRRRKSEGGKKARAKEKAAKAKGDENTSSNINIDKDTSSKLKSDDDTSSNLTIDIDIDRDIDRDIDTDIDVVNIKEMSPTKVDDRALDGEKAKERAKKAQETIKAKEHFEELWALYPAKKGKNLISDKRKRDLLSISVDEMQCFINRYKRDIELDHNNGFARQWLNGSTWFNGRWQDYTDENYQPAPTVTVSKGGARYRSVEGFRDFSDLEE